MTRLQNLRVRLDSTTERASRALHLLGSRVCLPVLVVLVAVDVVLRYIFAAPLAWGRDLSGVLLLLVLFLSMPYCWDRGQHIRMDMLYDRAGSWTVSLAHALTVTGAVLSFGLLAAQSFRFLPYMMATHEAAEDLPWPLWPLMAVMGTCSLLFVLRAIARPGEPAAAPTKPQ